MTNADGPRRMSRRASRRMTHVLVDAGILLAVWIGVVVLVASPDDRAIATITDVTGYACLVLILLTLAIGPWRLVRGKPNPVSSDLTRDVGIAAGVLGIVHVGCSLWVHLTGVYPSLPRRVIEYFFSTGDLKFSVANVLGGVGLVILVVLTIISSDRALRRFGRARWKLLQRSNYALVILVLAHTSLFWLVLDRSSRIIVVTLIAAGIVLALQLRGIGLYRARRAARTAEPDPEGMGTQ